MENKRINIKNRKASFEYAFEELFTAGMVLTGTEIKSIREGRANINEAHCIFQKGELFIKNMYIDEYKYGTHYNHDPRRDRKLLLNKKEIRKLFTKVKEKGLTIVPVRLFLNNRGLAKLEIALAKGKKLYDKREDIKQRDIKRDMERYK